MKLALFFLISFSFRVWAVESCRTGATAVCMQLGYKDVSIASWSQAAQACTGGALVQCMELVYKDPNISNWTNDAKVCGAG